MVVFDRPIGAQVDIKELEYISALHQSGSRLRPDGSIRDKDIRVYLQSRFGIEVSLEEVRKTILQGLGGSDNEGEVIDLMELTAIIIIPLLLKAAAVTKEQELPPNVVPPPERLLEMVVKIILHDVSGSQDAQQILTPEFLRRMLTLYGETELAQDDKLIQEMIQAASGGSHYVPKEFNAETFAEGLTMDVQLYNIANEVRMSTSVQDVFDEQYDPSSTLGATERSEDVAVVNAEQGLALMTSYPARKIETLKRIYTAPAIDIQAGTYRSKALTLCLWGAVLFNLFTCVLLFRRLDLEDECSYDSNGGWFVNTGTIVCALGNSMRGSLFIFVMFCFFGMLSMGMGSLGNYPGHTRWYLPLLGAIYIVNLSTNIFNRLPETDYPYLKYMASVSTILSILTAYFHIGHLITIVTKVDFENSKWARRLGLATLGREVHVKTAGAHKLNTLICNAAKLMGSDTPSFLSKTYFGHGKSAFTRDGVSKETAGGVVWLWRRVLDQSLFEKEGIWYSTRLVASNFAQFCICLFILLFWISTIKGIMKDFGSNESITGVSVALYQLLNSSGVDTTQIDWRAVNNTIVLLYPNDIHMVTVPLGIGACVAVMSAFRLVTLYLPGVTTSILKLRSGVIPSLHSPEFQKYREAPDTVTLLTGTLFWGCLVSSMVFGMIVASMVFLSLWQVSRYFMLKVATTLVGAAGFIGLRFVLAKFCCRKPFYRGLYRTKPAAANVSLLAFEWANFFFTAAFIVVRMFNILLVAAASIGQIDRRLLAEGVGQLGPFEFDPYPTIHVRDLVAHEAHRHPFIEILGTVYLMKLRYAKNFGSRAGSAWRLLFIYALMPWVHPYRILGEGTDTAEEYPKSDEQNSESEQVSIVKHESIPRQLTILEDASSIEERLLEIEYEKLRGGGIDPKLGGWAVRY